MIIGRIVFLRWYFEVDRSRFAATRGVLVKEQLVIMRSHAPKGLMVSTRRTHEDLAVSEPTPGLEMSTMTMTHAESRGK